MAYYRYQQRQTLNYYPLILSICFALRNKCTKCKEELENKYIWQRGRIYLLYLLVIKGKENNLACRESALSRGLWISVAHKHKFPFFPLISEQM